LNFDVLLLFSIEHQLRWILKPRLIASEACHRLALSEGQKENKNEEKEVIK